MEPTKKARGFLGEFKTFIARGNVLDLAVGVIIGGAFSAITTSLVNDIINPILGIFTGSGEDLAAALSFSLPGGGELMLGSFINAIVNFLIMAFVVFCIVKFFNGVRDKADALKKKEEEAAAESAPAAPAGPTQEELLAEIRDLLKAQSGEHHA